jgi:hypothetical protein
VISQVFLVILIQCLVEMNATIAFPNFKEKNGKCQLNTCLDFHDLIHRLQIIHEDVQIKLFRYSLEVISLDWCRALPNASIISLANFHVAFHLFCKRKLSVDLLYHECCHDFSLLNKYLNIHKYLMQ